MVSNWVCYCHLTHAFQPLRLIPDYCAPFVEADVDAPLMRRRRRISTEAFLLVLEPSRRRMRVTRAPTIAAQGNERTKMLKALKGEST